MGLLDSILAYQGGLLGPIGQRSGVGDWNSSVMRGDYPHYSGVPYVEPFGDPSGSTPMTGPYPRELMPQQTTTVDAGGYGSQPSGFSLSGLIQGLTGSPANAAPMTGNPQPATPAAPQSAPAAPSSLMQTAQRYMEQPMQPPEEGPSGYLNDGPVRYPVFGQPDAQKPDATLPAGATPTQGQLSPQQTAQYFPQQAAEGGEGFIEKLVAAMNPALGAQNTAKRNQTQMARALYGALVQRGMPQQQAFAVAQAAATDPKMAETLLPQALGLKPPATMEGVIAEQAYNANRFGQQGGGGQSSTMNTYADFLRTKNAAEKAGTTEGERVANAQLDLPSAVAQAKEGLRLLETLKTHKGRDNFAFWHGKTAAYLPDSAIPGNTDARDAASILGQIKGGAFLEAFKALKGGGQITEVEGKKATDAITRMDRSQSRAEFDRALSDYEGVIRLGIDRANQQAGKQAPYGFKGNTDWKEIRPGVRIRQVQ